MLDATAVNAIKELAQAAQTGEGKIVEIEGVKYSTASLHDVRKPDPDPDPVVLATLSGLVAFINGNVDGIELEETLVHVVNHSLVRFQSALYGDFEQRNVFAEVQCPDRFGSATAFAFGKYMSPESLIIGIQALFENDHDRKDVLALLGNVRDEFVRNATDDGVSQEVSVKGGITLIGERRVPNPVQLAPFRTFDELEQPASPFVLRLRKTDSGEIVAALFEADGGAWRTESIRRIAAFLKIGLTDKVAIVA